MSTQFDNNQARPKGYVANNDLGFDVASLKNLDLKAGKNNPAVLTLLENGMILNCNKAGADLLGCEPEKLKWQPVSRLMPQMADLSLVLDEKINPYLKFLSVVGHHFEVRALNGAHFACELFFSEVEEFGRRCLRVVMQPIRDGQPRTLRHLRTY
jgi:PAS domain-containing protein